MVAPINSITDYSQTQRLVLLIDLNPILHLPDPNVYLTSILATAKTILSFSPLSSSLFSFKPFFSSLSPLLSSSKLSISSSSLSFNLPNSTLESLTQFLSSLASSIDTSSTSSLPPRASLLSASMRQLVHDYAWDSVISDSFAGTLSNCNSFVKSNLVVLLSPIIRSRKCLSDFFGVEIDDECLRNVDSFVQRFHDLFDSVNDAFVSREIHFSWVDVKYEMDYGRCRADSVEAELDCGFLESGIRGMGWGFCSTESIILGSALVPFGLIYPRIGILPRFGNLDRGGESINAQLSLEIVDVSGKPLECKFCDLQLVNLDVPCGITSFEPKEIIWKHFSHGIVNIHVKAVQRNITCLKFEGKFADPVLVRESPGHSEKGQKEKCREYFEHRVLDILSMETVDMASRKYVAIWQILLSFLFREDCWALVSLSNSNGDSLAGVMKPFTVSSALLSIVEDSLRTGSIVNEFDGPYLGQSVPNKDIEKSKPEFDLSCFGLVESQSVPASSPSAKCSGVGDCSKKKNRKNLNMLLQLTWSAFCKAAFENFHISLEDVYFARDSKKSKKLKFLKCWMKQAKKTGNFSLSHPESSKKHQESSKETDERLTKLPPDEEPIASCSSIGDDSLTGASRVQDEAALDFCSETLESFFNNLPQKIQQGLESEDIHLESLANRLVNSSIYWLYRKYETVSVSDSQNYVVKSDDASSSKIAMELKNLLLRDPKDLTAMSINGKASDPNDNGVSSGNTVRQYELQILFRLEMLQSEVGASFGESIKQKFVKQICLLLENIQCQLQGGFFGDWSLDKYVAKIIKSRYCQCLGDVVQKIYTKMDLLLFEDEDESTPHLLNSDNSHQSRREEKKRDEKRRNKYNKPVSADGEPLQPVENNRHETLQGTHQVHARIIEAQQRRERARRFASFTSWVPDLRRVWAPKQQQKAVHVKADLRRKLSKRKEQSKICDDTVCETPMSGIKRSCSRGSGRSVEDCLGKGTDLCGSVSKALFQDY